MSNLLLGNKIESIFDGKANTIYDKVVTDKGEEQKLLHIVNDDPLDFEETTAKSLTTTTQLAMQINEIFKPLFSDWHGSEIQIDQNNNCLVTFVFKAVATGDNDKRAFLPADKAVEKSANSLITRMAQINAQNNSKNRNLEITQYGREMMYDIMLNNVKKGINVNDPNTFRKYIAETSETAGYLGSVQNIYDVVVGIDIYKVLGILFGVKDSKKRRICYKINPIRTVTPQMMPGHGRANYIVEIEKTTEEQVNKAMTKFGMTPIIGAITAVTDTISNHQ